jgi:hypothetical protein
MTQDQLFADIAVDENKKEYVWGAFEHCLRAPNKAHGARLFHATCSREGMPADEMAKRFVSAWDE